MLRRDLWDLFHRLAAERGTTLLVSSHVMDEAERCHRLLLLRDGALLADDTPEALRPVPAPAPSRTRSCSTRPKSPTGPNGPTRWPAERLAGAPFRRRPRRPTDERHATRTIRVLATTRRVLRQLRHDPRTIALMLVVPLVLLTLLYWAFHAVPAIFDRSAPRCSASSRSS